MNFFADKAIFFTYGSENRAANRSSNPRVRNGIEEFRDWQERSSASAKRSGADGGIIRTLRTKGRSGGALRRRQGRRAFAMAITEYASARSAKTTRRRIILAAGVALLLGAMALDTTVVEIGGDSDMRQQAFNPNRFGQDHFPRIRDFVQQKAPEAPQLAQELRDDRAGAIARHGTMAGAFPVIPVSFSGTIGAGSSGIFAVDVPGMPEGSSIRIQTGPAINGTELRDVTGDIQFGAFRNQIEYQDAGSGINRAMAAQTLADIDRETLTGAQVRVTGVFTMINPANWLVTPVAFEVLE